MLSAMLSFLLWVFAALLAAVIAALAMPVKIGIRARNAPDARLRVEMRPFGGMTPPIGVHDSAQHRAEKTKPTADRRKPSMSRRTAARIVRAIIASPELLAGVLRAVHLDRLSLDADIGLEDPADTGQLFGLLSAVKYSRSPASLVSIDLRPDFTGPRATGELEAVLRFVPAALIPPGIRFAWRVFGPAR